MTDAPQLPASSKGPEEIREWLVAAVAARVGADPRRIDPSERFSRFGIDSMKAASVTADLSTFLDRPLPRTLLWDYPSISAVVRHLTAPGDDAAAATTIASAAGSHEPIAIVGLACRFPGAPSAEAFWRLLLDGTDAITEVPADRWNIDRLFSADPTSPGKMSTRWGGFLQDVDQFDPQFFGISPREAAQMDPQQRIVLELAWLAIEDAGIRIPSLKESMTGVYIGAMWSDYARLIAGAPAAITQHTATGQDTSIIAARVSYTFGLQGPCLAINTACSSSLVAVQTACQALRSGQATLAIAGGVNLVLAPDSTVAMSKFGGMAPDGRSKAFDARANGYVRSEGAGLVVLKPLSQAIKDADSIYCVILGEGINNDGFSNGLTAPNPQAQEQMLRLAYARAGVSPTDVDYVETHGTGTLLGDPIEAGALGRVLGAGRPASQPLAIGSLKTNIGHLEAAAGIAGLIKTALSLRHGTLPGNLHFQSPNPHIDFDGLHLTVQRETTPLPARDRAVIAGVSSFGFGGTNCHIVLQEWRRGSGVIVPISAGTADARRDAVERLATLAATGQGVDAPALSRNAWERLSGGEYRAAVTVRRPGDLARQLSLLAAGETGPGIASGQAASPAPRIAWVLSAHGGQWAGMGRQLLDTEPAFRAAIMQCAALIEREAGWSLVDELLADEAHSHLGDMAIAQPTIFAVQVGIGAILRSWGIVPDVVVGHSMGEVAAAHLAGVLSLEDAVKVICHRSRLLARTSGKGALALVGLSPGATARALEGRGDRLWIVAFNSPMSTLVSGDVDQLASLVSDLERDGVFCRRVRVDVAPHSPHTDPLLDELEAALASIAPSAGTATMVSTVTATELEGASFGAGYWRRNLRQPVLFAQAIDAIIAAGPATFVEVGPHPVLAPAVEQALAARDGHGSRVVETLRRAEDEHDALLDTAARLYVAGHPVQWDVFTPPAGATRFPDGVVESGTCQPARDVAFPFVLSSHGPRALAERARVAAATLRARPDVSLRDACYTLAARRAHQPHRLAAAARDVAGLADVLTRFADGDIAPGVSVGERDVAGPGRTVFVFPGQGAQWLGMGRRLWSTEPAFRAAIERCDRSIAAVAGWSAIAELHATPDASRLDRIDVIQPVLFAVQVALAELWRAWGVHPDAVVGHSMGEAAAACVSGALSLDDAAALICRRSAFMRQVSGLGAMALVELSFADAAAAIRGLEDRVSVAVSNSARSTVLSGDPSVIDGVMERLTAAGVFCKRVKVDVASHSPHMDGPKEELRQALSAIAPRASAVPFYSTVTGMAQDGAGLDAAYWARNLREPVLFSTAVRQLLTDGYDTFIELSPHPLLVTAVQDSLRSERRAGIAVGSFSRDDADERASMVASLGALFTYGHDLAAAGIFADGGKVVAVAPYCWDRQRCWIESDELGHDRDEPGPDECLYELQWVPEPLAAKAAGGPRRWIVLANDGSALQAAARRLERAGHRVVLVGAPELGAARDVPSAEAALDGALERVATAVADGCDAIVHGWTLDAAGAPSGVSELSAAVDAAALTGVRLVQLLDKAGVAPRLYFVTCGAQPAGGALVTAPSHAALWGLGSAIAVEHPDLRCTRIDLDDRASDTQAAALFAELSAMDDQDMVAFRADRRLVGRLKKGIDTITVAEGLSRVAAVAASNPDALRGARDRAGVRADQALAALLAAPSLPDLSEGTCLVTGGLAGIGLVTAEWLVQQGARSLALMARRAPSPSAAAAIDRMRQAGAAVSVFQGDVSSAEDVSRALAAVRATMRPLKGIVHAAGVLDDALLTNLGTGQYRNVLAPKVQGAWLLHELTASDRLDFFVLYSSVLAYLGAAGQANHAVANAFLDALAHYRRGRGLAATSINWGVWATVGSAAHSGRGDRLEAMGLGAISPGEACDALLRILSANAVQGSVMRFSPERWRDQLAGVARSGLLAGFAASSAEASATAAVEAGPSIADQLAAATPGEERRRIAERFVATRAARVLRLNAAQLDTDKPLRAMGLDSLLAVEFRNRLEADAGITIPTTLIWNYPTVAKLAPQIAERLGAPIEAATAAADAASDDLDSLLGALETLSDEDARRALLQDGERVADV